jgi:hypothetical protein
MTTSTKATPAAPSAPVAHTNLIAALSAVMDEIGSVKKEQFNQNQRYNFRGIDAVVNASSPVFRRHGVLVFPTLIDAQYDAVAARNGGAMTHTKVIVSYTFRHVGSDESLVATVPGEAFDSGDKSVAKAMSVAFRIALLQTLSLPTDDPDPDSQSYERGTGQPNATRPAAQSSDVQAQRAKEAVMNARTIEEVARMRSTIEGFDQRGEFTPEQAGNLYEVCEARVAALQAEASQA